MIHPHQPHEAALPPGTMHTQLLTQSMLDECMRALGRPLFATEVLRLDRILTQQASVSKHLKASTDRIVADLVKASNR